MALVQDAVGRLTAAVDRLQGAANQRLAALDAMRVQHEAERDAHAAAMAAATERDAERESLIAVTRELGVRLEAALVQVKTALGS